MADPVPLSWLSPTPIAQLQPLEEASAQSVTGIVTLIWPYSASRSSYSFLLVEPDFRLRRHKGQVRLRFFGSSAKAVAKAGLKSGDKVVLSLSAAQWTKDVSHETADQTPGRGIEWELCFQERVTLEVRKVVYALRS